MKINSVTDINGTVIPFAENVKTEQSDFSDYLSQAQEQTKTVSLDDIFEKAKSKDEEYATLFFTTHTCLEADMLRVISDLKNESFIKAEPFMIRIES